MRKWKRTAALFLAVAALLCGCSTNGDGDMANGSAGGKGKSQKQDGQQGQSVPEGGMGRYLESEAELSDQLASPASLVRRTDGSLAVFDREAGLFLSYDDGQSWEKGECGDFPRLARENAILASAYSPEGNLIAAYVPPEGIGGDGSIEPVYLFIDAEGNQRELPIQCDSETGYLYRFWYMGEGLLYGQGFGRNVYQISETDGSMKKVLDMELAHMTAIGGQLLLTHQEGFSIYNPATGALTEDAVLDGFLEEHFKNTDLLGNTNVYTLLAAGSEDGQTVYLACRDGIYSHVLEGSLIEQAVDGSMVTIGDPRCGLVGMAALDNGEFLVLTADGLFRYTYDPDVAAVPEKQLQVYSLRDHLLLRQAITLYQRSEERRVGKEC